MAAEKHIEICIPFSIYCTIFEYLVGTFNKKLIINWYLQFFALHNIDASLSCQIFFFPIRKKKVMITGGIKHFGHFQILLSLSVL